MKKYRFLILILVVALLTGCSKSDGIEGRWKAFEGVIWEFAEDGIVIMDADALYPTYMNYQLSGDELRVGGGEGEDFTEFYVAQFNGKEIIIEGITWMTRE